MIGQFSTATATPFRAIHAQVLPTGQVLFWDSYNNADFPQLWNPSNGSFTAAAQAGYNIFCTGFAFMPNGHMLVTGGHISDFTGLPNTSDYDPFANVWKALPNMGNGRWYPTNTTLPNGNVLVVSGQIDTTVGMNPLPQVWDRASGAWRNLTNAQLVLPFYPYMYVAPNGKVFNAGPNQTTRYLDTSGTGAWSTVANNNFGPRTWGSSAMYDIGKIMIAGGTSCAAYDSTCVTTPTNTTEIINLNGSSPVWSYAAPMANARKHHNLTILPDGSLLVTGGSGGSECETCTSSVPVTVAEMWNPVTNTWATMASAPTYRGYHSIALLLPDGRVLSAGGNLSSTYETYSPPYLFKGGRPSVSKAPSNITYGQVFSINSPKASNIVKVTMVALPAVTHTFNAGQRINFLAFAVAGNSLNVTAPANSTLCPPGYYMLFIVDNNGIPSQGRIVNIQ